MKQATLPLKGAAGIINKKMFGKKLKKSKMKKVKDTDNDDM